MDKKQHKATCDDTRIELFLMDQMQDDERAAFERHLDGCDVCRQELERRAAEPGFWDEIRECLTFSQDLSSNASQERGIPAPPSESEPHTTSSPERGLASEEAVLRSLAPTDDPRMLGRLGTYEISGVIGYGGMGVVLKGFDTALNRYVAIKVLAPHLAASGSARRRFAREAQAAAAVVHENVVAIHGVAEAGGLPYFVMPLIRGASLQTRLNEHGPLAVTEILRIAMQAASGLAAAHGQGLVHRDIKPANILLEEGVERVKITDFGLARAADDASLTRTGVIAGTPQFMSPEQARGESVDARSDLFSLGSVMYAMCTGHPPFRAETSLAVLRRITDTEPRPIRQINAEIPQWLAAVIDALLAKAPKDRLGSAASLSRLLSASLAHVQQPTSVPLPEAVKLLAERQASSTEARAKQSRGSAGRLAWCRELARRPKLLAGAGAAVSVLTAAAILGITAWLGPRDHVDPPPAAATHGTASPAKLTSSTNDIRVPSTAWQDDAEDRILNLEQDVSELERNAVELWGAPESLVSPKNSTRFNASVDQEPSK